jgi:23S rRNA pseudouridine1911/1915/1917 synthase
LSKLPRAGIVHRLDKDTTGLLIVARNDVAREYLIEALAARNIEREYQAIAVGVMTSGGTVDAPIDRHPVDRVRMAVRTGGRDAVTHYRVIERFRRHTWVRVLLETGRTHQIRLHLAHAGYPLVGDQVYGRRLEIPRGATAGLEAALRDFRRQALHAAKLTFPHPTDGRAVEVTAPLPADFLALITALRRDRAAAER